MSRIGFVSLVVLLSGTLCPRAGSAEDNPAQACLEQCKEQTEQCVQAAGEDEEKLGQCSSDALACIQGCGSF